MSFIASKVLWALVSPDNLIVLLTLLGVAAWALRRRCASRAFLGASSILICAITFLPLGDWLLRPLETRFPQPVLTKVDGIIILGGGIDQHLTEAWGQPTLTPAAARLVAASTLARQYPGARVLYAGGSASLRRPDLSEADSAAAMLTGMGIAQDRLILEKRSRNSFENAKFAQTLAQPKPGESWALVTSAYHMPRAMGIFRKLDWPVIAYPVDYSVMPAFEYRPGFFEGLTAVFWGVKEWVGLGAYYLMGRTSALFPGFEPEIPAGGSSFASSLSSQKS